jgi:3-dehydroquinate dehydratase
MPASDALITTVRPVVEVHISDATTREPYTMGLPAPATRHQVIGHGWRSNVRAIDWLPDAAGTG